METLLRLLDRSRFRRMLLGLGLALFLLVPGLLAQVGPWARGESSPRGNQHLVLRNGQVMTGKVTHLGDRTVVALPVGGEVNLPTKEVLLTCDTLQEAYHHLAQRIHERRTATPYVELARWCLRHELFDEAKEQLAHAREIDRRHASLPVLERQLERAQNQALLAADRGSLTEPVPPRSSSSPSRVGSDGTNVASPPRAVRTHPPTTEELEDAMQSIPGEGVELFVNTIQPMMWNKCGTNRCHDVGGASDFRVLRPANGKQVWRRLSLRNLHTLLGYVDRDVPDSSLLLEKSRTPHGDLATPPLGGEDSVYYQQLLIWVRGVAGPRARLAAHPAAKSAPSETSQKVTGIVARASFEAPAGPEESGDEDALFDGETTRPGKTEDSEAPYQPRDPFDPEIFNRKFLPR